MKNHHIKNILFAIAVLEILNLNFEKIKNKLNELDILKERDQIIKVKHKNVNFNLIDESLQIHYLEPYRLINLFQK